MRVTITWTNPNPDTIYNRLAARLGRVPTAAEVRADVSRILTASLVDRATKGQLAHQRPSRRK